MTRGAPTARLRRATVASVAAAVLAIGGCADDAGEDTTVGQQLDGTTSTAADGSSTTTGSSGGTSPPTAADGGTPTSATNSRQPTTTTTISADVAPGKLAGFFLRPAASDRIVVELRAQPGAAPRQATIDHLAQVLRDVSGKAVTIDGPRAVAGGAQSWSVDELTRTADRASTHRQSSATSVMRLLYLHGDFAGDERVLGISVRGDVAAIFSDQVQAAGGVLTGAGPLEDAVTVHEAGHLLGLVDLFVDTGRDDPEHPGHSRNPDSVMYWAVESSLVTEVLTGGPPRNFDAADRADLRRIRNG